MNKEESNGVIMTSMEHVLEALKINAEVDFTEADANAKFKAIYSALKKITAYESTAVELKAKLKAKGYYTAIMWQEEDVLGNYEGTPEQAQKVLHGALNNEATTDQVWYAISVHAEDEGLTIKGEKIDGYE